MSGPGLPPRPPGVRIVAIAAMAENRVIGAASALPWNLPEDLQWFRERTLDRTLLMGRKTYAAIGRPLPRRRTIVLTHSAHPIEGIAVIDHLGWLEPALAGAKELWICGGAEIYALTLPWWDELWLTRVKQRVRGDAVFPEFEHRLRLADVVRETREMRIEHYLPAG